MDSARNLKLGSNGAGAIARAQLGAVGQMWTLLIQLCAWKRCSGVQGRASGQGVRGANPLPPKLKHLAFGRAMKANNLPAF